jgi:two-component system chemotaxis response regulator CheB
MNPAGAPIGVLIVDDSATVRAVLRRLLAPCDDIVVVGEAGNGREAVAAAAALAPHVILMDVEMPHMDGVEATQAIMGARPTPILVITSRSARREVRAAFQCFSQGALEVLAKPEHPAAWEAMAQALPEKIRALAGAAPPPRTRIASPAPACPPPRGTLRCIAVAASTGGPPALAAFLAAFARPLPAPVLIVQHISPGFEAGLAEWLATVTGLEVALATHGEVLGQGQVRVAPGDHHLRVTPRGTLELDGRTPPLGGHRPSADQLFTSCAEAMPTHTAGILLTGMGRDGAEGLLRLRRAGGLALVQDEASCAVFGMPRAALELDPTLPAMPPAALAAAVEAYAGGGRR